MGKKVSFEDKLEKLENIVGGLESGELSLEESLKNFSSGVELYNECKKYLSEVEAKVTKLSEDLVEKDLD